MSRATAWWLALMSVAVVACEAGSESADPDAAVVPDGGEISPDGGVDAPPDSPVATTTITITTLAPQSTVSIGGKTSASWAAQRAGGGAWRPLAATGDGTYVLMTGEASWSVAFACDDGADSSAVAVYRRPSTTTTLEVTLDTECARAPSSAHAITGSITNVPASTSWVSFGYALSSRGSVVGVAGTTASYEVVNVADGTWDLMYGIRDDSGGPLTRVALQRAQMIAADVTRDFDMGALGVTPTAKPFVVHGVAAAETLSPTMSLVASGTFGLDVGPQDVPTTVPDVTMAYDSVPAASLVATDRFRLDVQATSEPMASLRRVLGSFHTAASVDVTLPAAIDPPTVAVSSATPYLRLSTRVAARATAATYETAAEAAPSRRSRRRWSASVDAALAAAVPEEITPDLSGVAGFRAIWALPSGVDLTVTGAVKERATPLGDGTMERSALRGVTFKP